MIKILDHKSTSKYETIEYLIIQIYFNNLRLGDMHLYLTFKKDDINLIEFGFSYNTNGDIGEITLVTAHSFKIINKEYKENDIFECKTLSLTESEPKKVDLFDIEIYNNAILINFSNKKCTKNILCGDVLFKLDENNNILSIVMLNVNEEVRNHTIEELKYANN